MKKYCIIEGFNNYAISSDGIMINVVTKRELSPQITTTGYIAYNVCQNGVKKRLLAHRMVALYFCENPYNKPYVNHLDGNKQNNRWSNLEWCTAKENDQHARQTGLKKQNKPIVATNILDNEQVVFDSIGECASVMGLNKGSIHRVLVGKRKKYKNHYFSYLA